MRDLLGLRILLTITGVALAVGFAFVVGYDSTLIVGTLVAGVGLLLLVLFNLLTIPLQADLRFGWITVAELVRQAVATVLVVVLVIAGAGIVPFLATQIPAGIVALAITVVLVYGTVSLRPRFEPAAWWALVRETLPYAVAIAIAALYFRIVIVLMSLVSTDTQTGYFATSYRVIEVLVVIPALLVGATFPVMSRAARDDADRLLYAGQRTFDVMLIVGVWLTLCVALGADFMIQVIGGKDFEPSVDVLRIQSLAVMFTFVTVTCGFMLLSLRRHRAILASTIVPLAFGVILTLAITPSEGAKGAAIATVAAEAGFAVAVLTFLKWRSVAHVPLSLRVFLPVGAAAALAASVELVLPGVHDLVTVTLATAVYFGVLAALGQIPPELRGALFRGRGGGD